MGAARHPLRGGGRRGEGRRPRPVLRRPPLTERLLLLYDGDCSICEATRNLVASLDSAGRFDFITLKEAGAHPRLGAWPSDRWKGNFHLVMEDRVLSGEDAIPQIVGHLRGGALPAWLLGHAPGGRWLTGRLYRWVALNRERWGRQG